MKIKANKKNKFHNMYWDKMCSSARSKCKEVENRATETSEIDKISTIARFKLR